MSLRVGPAMLAVLAYVQDHPGCTKADAARYADRDRDLRTGYAAVDRSIRAGLLLAVPLRSGYALTLTPLGSAVLEGRDDHG